MDEGHKLAMRAQLGKLGEQDEAGQRQPGKGYFDWWCWVVVVVVVLVVVVVVVVISSSRSSRSSNNNNNPNLGYDC